HLDELTVTLDQPLLMLEADVSHRPDEPDRQSPDRSILNAWWLRSRSVRQWCGHRFGGSRHVPPEPGTIDERRHRRTSIRRWHRSDHSGGERYFCWIAQDKLSVMIVLMAFTAAHT